MKNFLGDLIGVVSIFGGAYAFWVVAYGMGW